MPIIKGAKKALRQNKKKRSLHDGAKSVYKKELNLFKKSKDPKKVSVLFSLIDKLSKNGIIHRNKANRLKAQISKIAPSIKKEVKEAAVKKTIKKETPVKTKKTSPKAKKA